MTLRHNQTTGRTERTSFVSCPKCGTELDSPVKEGGTGMRFPAHWRHRCPANPAVEADQ